MATRRRYIDLPDHARRDFVKWSIGIGAALGLQPWKVFEVQESIIGSAFAQSASTLAALRSVHVLAGNGGLAWFTQTFPFYEIAADTTNNMVSYYNPGKFIEQTVDATRGDQPLRLGADAPAALAKYNKKMTVFTCGKNETHTGQPSSAAAVAGNVAMFAAGAAIQTAQPTLVPAIAVGMLPFGTAAGAPALASVPNAQAIAGLFKSVAASAGNALEKPANAALFEAYFKANLALQKAAQRPTQTQTLLTAKAASNLLGKQLDLAPSAADLQRYGVDDTSLGATGATKNKAKLVSIATTLIQTFKAFQQNLTSMVMLPAMNDDPHGAFNDMATLQGTVKTMGAIFNAFIEDTMSVADPLDPTKKIGDNLVLTITGDTFKNPNNQSGWGDGTPNNANLLIVYDGSGRLAGGSFGGVNADGSTNSFDPSTGAAKPNAAAADHMAAAAPASAAVLHAISKGDTRRVADFYRGGSYNGVLNKQLIGL